MIEELPPLPIEHYPYAGGWIVCGERVESQADLEEAARSVRPGRIHILPAPWTFIPDTPDVESVDLEC